MILPHIRDCCHLVMKIILLSKHEEHEIKTTIAANNFCMPADL